MYGRQGRIFSRTIAGDISTKPTVERAWKKKRWSTIFINTSYQSKHRIHLISKLMLQK